MEHSRDHGIARNYRGADQPRDKARAQQVKTPAAGPQSTPELTDVYKTPGAGTIPPPGGDEAAPAADDKSHGSFEQ
jgi:hypothetical protein